MQWILKPADCPIPTLYAISAMGTALRFYSVNTRFRKGRIVSHSIPCGSNDRAPKETWNLDLLTDPGKQKLCAIVEEINQECAAL
jgi:hypothetical protein